MANSRILMVDDEVDLELLVRQRFRRRIRKGEFEFLFAHNGVEALETLENNPDIRLVLSDINMPEMDGLTLLSQLESANPEICAVIISAYGDMANIRTAMNRGAFDFVTKPIDFNDLQITIEKTLAHIEMIQQALASRDRLVSLKQELAVAKNVQESVLPAVPPPSEYYDLYAQMTPAREIGGDFYDYFRLDDHRLGLVIADVSGKGVPAALFTMVTRALLKSAARNHESPAYCLSEVNELLSQENDACMFVTLFYGVLDLRDGRLQFSNGGHNPPRIVRGGNGAIEAVPQTGNLALGIVPGHEFNQDEVQLDIGDALFFYTDGITEACNTTDDEFGEDRLDVQLGEKRHSAMGDLVDVVVKAVEDFAIGMEQFDDMTCLALRWNAVKPADAAPGTH
ncbi:MAG: SpoIIE family protein phosphatase [Gammaproteobacteria bacterium]|nr:SpoIIE family protein phosphatase [Gammaproteobacteria bacterium]MDE0364571.1 SpoIIE family protein phosphatase [Gammaproteobacteria bacterium]